MFDFEGYWNLVLGADRDARSVLGEFGLDPTDRAGLSEWLGRAEAEAWRVCGDGGDVPGEWSEHHTSALKALGGAAVEGEAMATKISWRDVPLTHAAEGRPARESERVKAMAEYRDTAARGVPCINDWFLCDVETFETTDDGDDLAQVGPSVDEIDWTGFPG